jgi:hypothetical protein
MQHVFPEIIGFSISKFYFLQIWVDSVISFAHIGHRYWAAV